jgi:carbonic anhydrase
MTIPSVATPFEALQFHIHTSSEHALDGTHFGAELHIVHQEVGGQGLAVLGLFLDPHSFAETNHFEVLIPGWEDVAAATSVLCGGAESNSTDVATTQGLHRRRHLTRKDDKTKQRKLSQSFNPYDLIPEGATFYYYSGSLTTPPCSEIVSWNVVDTPVSLSVREFLALDSFILDYVSPETCELATVAGPAGGTSRPTQPINGRTITHKCPSGTESRFPTEEASSTQSEDDAQPNSTDTNSGAATIAAASGLIGTLAMTLMVML